MVSVILEGIDSMDVQQVGDRFQEDLSLAELREKARAVRRHIVKMLGACQSGHPGGSFSCVEILVALYFAILRIKPDTPRWEERDRFVLSKGHAAPALYAVLAEREYFPVSTLMTLRQLDSILQGHPSMKATPGVDMTTGSLGQGISAAVGMALAGKLLRKSFRVYALLGDGEFQSGQVWEAVMAAAHYRLDNLTLIVDYNKLQIDGPVKEVMNIEPLGDKLIAFNWAVSTTDGHDFDALTSVFREPIVPARPKAVIALTVKGKGCSFMENRVEYHGAVLSEDMVASALGELT